MNTIIITIAIVLALLIAFSPEIKGWIGEKTIARKLKQLPEEDYIVLNDIMLKTSVSTTQIDHIVVSIYGIFVIETKNYKGWIYGSEQSNQWVQNMYGKKYQFRNPIKQNYGHIKALETVLELSVDKFIPIVVFLGSATLKVKVKSLVIYPSKLVSIIRAFSKEIINREDIKIIESKLIQENNDNKSLRMQHVKDIHTKVKNEQDIIKEGICPKCGGKLVTRKGKYGEFLGCSNYPKCKFTK